jgi:O-antigen ligase
MTLIQIYILAHIFLRSFSNGIDRIYNTEFSLVLSTIAISIAFVASYQFLRTCRVPSTVLISLLLLSIFVGVCILSIVFNALFTDNIIDWFAVWYTVLRYVYLIAFLLLTAMVYQRDRFCRDVHLVYMFLLLISTLVGLGQYLTGHTILVTKYDKFERVAGLSSHPVTFSLEIVLLFCVCELSRRKLSLNITLLHASAYSLFVFALIVAASRTGVVLLLMILGAYLLVRRPSLFPVFGALAIVLIVASPFQELFSELNSVPEYIMRGDYVVWDYRTAVTSVHWRIHHWYYLTSHAIEELWFGYGPGQERLYSPFDLEAHNQFVEIFFETGLLGLVSFVCFWFSIAAIAIRRGIRTASMENGIRAFWVIMFIGVTLVALFDQSFNTETVAFSHLILSALVVSAHAETISTSHSLSCISVGATSAAQTAIRSHSSLAGMRNQEGDTGQIFYER